MPIVRVYNDFFSFLDRLAPGGEPWALYCEQYFDKHPALLTAWLEQCLGKPREVLRARVESALPEHYTGLRALLESCDIEADAQAALDRCRKILPAAEPVVNLLVGFFSPDGFVLEVAGEWQIGLGLERLGEARRVSLLAAHEYAHWYRRSRGLPAAQNLGERLIEEGLAVHLSHLAFPKRSLAEHLFISEARLATLRDYRNSLIETVRKNLACEEESAVQRFVYSHTPAPDLPPRPGGFVGFELLRGLFSAAGDSYRQIFDLPAASLLEKVSIGLD